MGDAPWFCGRDVPPHVAAFHPPRRSAETAGVNRTPEANVQKVRKAACRAIAQGTEGHQRQTENLPSVTNTSSRHKMTQSLFEIRHGLIAWKSASRR